MSTWARLVAGETLSINGILYRMRNGLSEIKYPNSFWHEYTGVSEAKFDQFDLDFPHVPVITIREEESSPGKHLTDISITEALYNFRYTD